MFKVTIFFLTNALTHAHTRTYTCIKNAHGHIELHTKNTHAHVDLVKYYVDIYRFLQVHMCIHKQYASVMINLFERDYFLKFSDNVNPYLAILTQKVSNCVVPKNQHDFC